MSLVFQHWVNLTYLTLVAGALVVGHPLLAALGLLVEGLALWIVPDIPGVQRHLTNQKRLQQICNQRNAYLKTLWGAEPIGNVFFMPQDPQFTLPRNTDTAQNFFRLHRLVHNLPAEVTSDVRIRLREMLNGYLSMLVVSDAALRSIGMINRDGLAKEFERLRKEMEKSDTQDKAFRVVLAERLRSIKAKTDALPRLDRRSALALAQAENIVQAIEATVIQLQTQGAVEVGAFASTPLLDTPMFDDMEIATEVRGLTSQTLELDVLDPKVWEDISNTLGTKRLK